MCEMVLIPKLQEDNILPIEMPFFFAINLILFAILVELYMNTPLFLCNLPKITKVREKSLQSLSMVI